MTALLYSWLVLSGCHGSSSSHAEHIEPLAPVQVQTVDAATVQVPVVVDANGQIVGEREARVAAGTSGRVTAVHVERGSRVKQGDLLLEVDARLLAATRDEARAAVTQAESQVSVADDECRRARALHAKQLTNEAALLQAESRCASAQASLEAARSRLRSAEVRLADTRVKAPFTGVVSERMVSPGEFLRDDSAVVGLVGTSDLRLELTIGERQAPRIVGGETVRFRIAGDTRDRQAIIDRMSPALRENGRDLVVEAKVVEDDVEGLRPGAFVHAGVETAAREAIAVPVDSVKRDGAATRAWVVVEGHVEERIVSVGRAEGDSIPVLDGLSPGDRVVVSPPANLRDGAPVVE